MYLPRSSREYLRITLANVPSDATVEASFDGGTSWKPTTGTGTVRSILIAGPDAPAGAGATVLLDDTDVSVRITDTSEVVVRRAGRIRVV